MSTLILEHALKLPPVSPDTEDFDHDDEDDMLNDSTSMLTPPVSAKRQSSIRHSLPPVHEELSASSSPPSPSPPASLLSPPAAPAYQEPDRESEGQSEGQEGADVEDVESEESERDEDLNDMRETETVNTIPVPYVTPKAAPAPTVPLRKVVPPPPIKFDAVAIPWKGLPLDAALWTVDSAELQGLVSRAIRSSAKESFIRLLTPDNLDKILPAELERLETRKLVVQSQYRFLVHRRTMLFQALGSPNVNQQPAKDGEEGRVVVNDLVSQLAETVTGCEQQLQELFQINDQVAQINKLIDVHWASALAIALRKLNASYARRTADLNAAREKISQLEAEVDDAWKEAEKMARELDDYEAAILSDSELGVIEAAEVVPVPKSPVVHHRRPSTPMTPTLFAVTPVALNPQPSEPDAAPAPVSTPAATPTAATFGFPSVHLKAKETEAEDVPDTVSIRSGRSTRSGKSYHSGRAPTEASFTSHVHAAKKRSNRASQGSLRLGNGHSRKHSNGGGRPRTPAEEQPPVPELPLHLINNAVVPFSKDGKRHLPPQHRKNAGGDMARFDTGIHPGLRRQASFDTIRTGATRSHDVYQGRSVDDIYVRLTTNAKANAANGQDLEGNPLNDDDSGEIRVVQRAPTTSSSIPPFTAGSTSSTSLGMSYSNAYDALYGTGNSKRLSIHNADSRPLPTARSSSAKPKERQSTPTHETSRTKNLIKRVTIAASKGIPSMWMNVDSVASPTQLSRQHSKKRHQNVHESDVPRNPEIRRPDIVVTTSGLPALAVAGSPASPAMMSPGSGGGEALKRSPTTTFQSRLKTLTKRYSVSLPMFTPTKKSSRTFGTVNQRMSN